MRLSVHCEKRMGLSLLLALIFVLPLVFLNEARADWLVREDAELAPVVAPAPAAAPVPSAEPAPQASEEKLAAPQQPGTQAAKCNPCPRREKGCPLKKQGAAGECNATHSAGSGCREANATKPAGPGCMGANATSQDMEKLMRSTMEFRVESLAQAKPDDPKVVELVGAKLSDPNPKLRREVVLVFGLLSTYYPEKAPEIFPYLLTGLNDSDPKVHVGALKALLPTVAHMSADSALPLLSKALEKGSSAQRAAIATVSASLSGKLAWIPRLSKPLLTALDDPDQNTQLAVIMALAFIDPALLPDQSITILRKNTADASAGTRFQAYSLLAMLGPKALEALPELLKGVEDPHNVPRWAAVRALGSLGQDAVLAHPEALDALVKALKDSDAPVQQAAALSLGKVLASPALPGVLPGKEHPAALEGLQKLMESGQPMVAESAAWALVRMAPKQRAALPETMRQRLQKVTPALDEMAAQ